MTLSWKLLGLDDRRLVCHAFNCFTDSLNALPEIGNITRKGVTQLKFKLKDAHRKDAMKTQESMEIPLPHFPWDMTHLSVFDLLLWWWNEEQRESCFFSSDLLCFPFNTSSVLIIHTLNRHHLKGLERKPSKKAEERRWNSMARKTIERPSSQRITTQPKRRRTCRNRNSRLKREELLHPLSHRLRRVFHLWFPNRTSESFLPKTLSMSSSLPHVRPFPSEGKRCPLFTERSLRGFPKNALLLELERKKITTTTMMTKKEHKKLMKKTQLLEGDWGGGIERWQTKQGSHVLLPRRVIEAQQEH